MSRNARLLNLLQCLRTLPGPVTATRLADETGVSQRTLYRDIDSLRTAGAVIDGAAGYGYRMIEDPALPPQTFSRLEIEALVLGLAEVRHVGDPELAKAADAVLAKTIATLPERLQQQAMHAVLQVYRCQRLPSPRIDMGLVREACWREEAIEIAYVDAADKATERRVYPLSIVYLDTTMMLLAWCCLRQDFRKFILTRISDLRSTNVSFRPRRTPLLREYIAQMRATTTAGRSTR